MHIFSGFTEIPGFPGYYVSEEGQIYSNRSKRLLVPSINGSGYLNVRLTPPNGKTKTLGVHRVICMTFKPYQGDFSKLIVNHIDGNKLNNRKENLERGTHGYNLRHAGNLGLTSKCRPILVVNPLTGDITEFPSIVDCANTLGVSKDKINYRVKTKGKVLFPEKLLYLFRSDKEEFLKNFMKKNYIKETHGTKTPIQVKNLISGEIKTFDRLSVFASELKTPLPTISSWFSKTDQPVVPGFYQIKLISDNSPWRDVGDIYLELSKTTGTKPVITTDLTGQTKIYISAVECCKDNSITPTCLSYRLKSNGKVFYSGKKYAYYTDTITRSH